jgi:hypothetical protein
VYGESEKNFGNDVRSDAATEYARAVCIKIHDYPVQWLATNLGFTLDWRELLKTGDSLTLPTSCGDRLVTVKIITDRGEATYEFKGN